MAMVQEWQANAGYFVKLDLTLNQRALEHPYYKKWNDGSDGGDVGSKVLAGQKTDTGFASLNKHTAPADICMESLFWVQSL